MSSRTLLALAAASLAAGCLANAELDYDRLHVSATHADADGTAIQGFPRDTCTVLPLLIGSRVENEYTLEHPLRVAVSATRDKVHVAFPGSNSPERTIQARELRLMPSEVHLVSGTTGAFRVTLSNKCPDLSDASF
jgi:hypothetical protein